MCGTDTNEKAEIFMQANPCAMPMHKQLFLNILRAPLSHNEYTGKYDQNIQFLK